jgi:hypothetical protein
MQNFSTCRRATSRAKRVDRREAAEMIAVRAKALKIGK